MVNGRSAVIHSKAKRLLVGRSVQEQYARCRVARSTAGLASRGSRPQPPRRAAPRRAVTNRPHRIAPHMHQRITRGDPFVQLAHATPTPTRARRRRPESRPSVSVPSGRCAPFNSFFVDVSNKLIMRSKNTRPMFEH